MHLTVEDAYKRIKEKAIDPSRPDQRHGYNITDFFSNYEEISKIPGLKESQKWEEGEKAQNLTIWQRVLNYFHLAHPMHWVFLILMAVITT